MKEQDKERERIRSISFAYGSEGWELHREADFVTISLGDNPAQQPQAQPKRRMSTVTRNNDAESSLVRNRSKSAGVREEFERESPSVPPRPGGFFSSLLKRSNDFIASSLSSLTGAPNASAPSNKPVTRPEDIFEPDTRREMELLAKENEDRMISRIHDELEKDEATRGAAVYRPLALDRDSEELRLAAKIESLFEQASERFSTGTCLLAQPTR